MGGVVTAAEIPWQDTVDVLDVTEFLEAVRPAWHARAACRGKTSVMFPQKQGKGLRLLWIEAVAVCASCTVIDECRAVSHHESFGVWAGEIKQFSRLDLTSHEYRKAT